MERTRLNREIAEQHGGGDGHGKTPGRETAKETEELHAGAGDQAEAAVADEIEQTASQAQAQPKRNGLYARASPLAAFVNAAVADPDRPEVADTAAGEGGDPVTPSRRG